MCKACELCRTGRLARSGVIFILLFFLLTQLLLVAHHAFAIWNGDRRLLAEHGDAFAGVRERTSVVPFAAILDGRQVLPSDYWRELCRAPYALIAVGTLGAYAAHPYMQAGAALATNSGLSRGGILDGLLFLPKHIYHTCCAAPHVACR